MANAIAAQQEIPFYHETSRNEMLGVGIVGFVVGIVVPLVGFLISRFAINPIFCQAANAGGMCDASSLVGYYVATVLVTAAAIPVLIGWGVFRALLIGVGAALTMWGLQKYIDPLAMASWIEYYTFSAVLFAMTYLLFYWIMRLKSFGASIVLSVTIVLLVRWALLT